VIIDVHAHLWEDFMGFHCPPVEQILQGMDRAGIALGLFSSLSGLLHTDPHEDNARLYSLVRKHPARMRGVAVVTPYAGRQALEELELCLRDYRFAGLKLHPWLQGYSGGADFLGPLLELCRSYAAPVLFHTGTPPYAQVFHVWVQARRFPQVTFVLGHMGLNYQWRDALELGRLCPNTVFDTSGISYTFAIRRLIRELGPGRVAFGSDNPFLLPDVELAKVLDLGLGGEELDQVLAGTARRVFPGLGPGRGREVDPR
jgi:predicted TIM-barrel fold metal-dependent hydrolase